MERFKHDLTTNLTVNHISPVEIWKKTWIFFRNNLTCGIMDKRWKKFWKNGDLWRFPIPQIIQGMADHEWQKWNRRGSRLLKRSPARPPPARPVHTEVPGAAERSVLLPDPATILRGGQGQRASNVIKYHQISSNINKCHQISSNVIKYHQISSNIINYHQISSNVIKYHQVSSNGTTT